MKYLHRLLLLVVASAAFFISSAQAQTGGTVANHAVPVGKGPGVQGLGSVGPCNSGIAIVGQGASSDPACGSVNLATGVTGTLPTARLPAPFTNGTASGNTTKFGTVSGSLTNGHCVSVDANGNMIDAGASCSTGGFAASSICNLKTAMDNHYGVGGWVYRTTIGSGTDIGPAISDCLTSFAGLLGRGVIYLPATGDWALKTGSIDLSGAYLVGDGSQATIVIVNVSPGANAFWWRGTGGNTGGGMRGIGILLESGLGTTTINGLVFSGNSSFQPDQSELRDVYMTSVGGASTWQNCLTFDGSARTAPQGVRVGYIANVQLFECNNVGAIFNNVVQFSISNLGVYVSTGAGQDVFITGAGSTLTNSIQVVMDNVIARNLQITNASRFFVRGWGSTIVVNTTATEGIAQFQGASSGTCGTGCTITAF